MKKILCLLVAYIIIFPAYADAITDDCSKSGGLPISITIAPKTPALIPAEVHGPLQEKLTAVDIGSLPPSQDIILGIAGFLSDRASAMAVDLAEDELFR